MFKHILHANLQPKGTISTSKWTRSGRHYDFTLDKCRFLTNRYLKIVLSILKQVFMSIQVLEGRLESYIRIKPMIWVLRAGNYFNSWFFKSLTYLDCEPQKGYICYAYSYLFNLLVFLGYLQATKISLNICFDALRSCTIRCR